MPRMTADQILQFVDQLIVLGCDVQAVTPKHYLIGDSDFPSKVWGGIRDERIALCERYGDRGHLGCEIAAYLYSIGRVYQFSPMKWRPIPTRHTVRWFVV